ncbi:hypothetical protein [Catenulispora subtropica]|uniref:DnaA N-terminal domain-containing protein n=1 Tax=Catenulispora subtropica TaxID=450798 RepID=A0ABN2TH28_9ACTN
MTTTPNETVEQAIQNDWIDPSAIADVHRDVLIAVQRGLAASWTDDLPRVAVFERDGIATVYVSTVTSLAPGVRRDIRGAVRAALAPYARLAPFTNVVFLTRGRP